MGDNQSDLPGNSFLAIYRVSHACKFKSADILNLMKVISRDKPTNLSHKVTCAYIRRQ
jgi:hypothetical protein